MAFHTFGECTCKYWKLSHCKAVTEAQSSPGWRLLVSSHTRMQSIMKKSYPNTNLYIYLNIYHSTITVKIQIAYNTHTCIIRTQTWMGKSWENVGLAV